jgi:hypothetical protein
LRDSFSAACSEQRTGSLGARRIGCLQATIDVPDDPVLVDDKGDPAGDAEKGVQNTVTLGNRLPGVTEQRKSGADFFGESFVARFAVGADSQNLCVELLKPGDTSLVRREFVGSGGRTRQDVKGQDYILPPAEVSEPDPIAVLIGEDEFRGWVTNAEFHRSYLEPASAGLQAAGRKMQRSCEVEPVPNYCF